MSASSPGLSRTRSLQQGEPQDMQIDDDGTRIIGILWGLTAIILLFVLLRVYTRAVLLKSYGIDDHVFVLAFVLFVFYALFISISTKYGFGEYRRDVPPDEFIKALLYQCIAQTFHALDMAVANWSLGLFLLRLVVETWHRAVLWTVMLLVMAGALVYVFVLWFGCSPPTYDLDNVINGPCRFSILPAAYISTVLCIFVDFFFAAFPWVFVWKLHMRRRDKICILVAMSLGVFAGACGIKQTTTMWTLESPTYFKDTVSLMIWSGAEVAVTMACIGIAVCLPLYKRIYERCRACYRRHRLASQHSRFSSEKRSKAPTSSGGDRYRLPHHLSGLTGSTLPVSWNGGFSTQQGSKKRRESQLRGTGAAVTLPATFHLESGSIDPDIWGSDGFTNPFPSSSITTVAGGRHQTGRGSREDFLESISRDAPGRETRGITDEEALTGVVVTNEVEVSRAPLDEK